MSLILEALRKSEAERRRGELPGLHVELPPAETLRAGPPRWLWFALAAGLIAVLATLWSIRATWRSAPTPAVDAALQPVAPTMSPPATDTRAGAAISPAAPPGGDIAATADASAGVAAIAADRSKPADRSANPAGGLAATVAEPTTGSAPPPTLAETPAGVSGPAPLPRSPPPALAAAPRPVPADAFEPAAAHDAAIESGAPIALADLGADERRALPALKISMHMWNEAPERRFVIIDGNRLTEGSRVGEAVVDRITPDGVLLAWQGRQLRLPIR